MREGTTRMKTTLAIVLTILLGIGLGVGIATVQMRAAKWTPPTDDRGSGAASAPAGHGPAKPASKR
jgi:hypothetical protein